jgi:hypothetical protein
MHKADVNHPSMFVYISGSAASRDPNKPPPYVPEYLSMRVHLTSAFPLSRLEQLTNSTPQTQGETGNQLLALATESKGDLEVCIAKPGMDYCGHIFQKEV